MFHQEVCSASSLQRDTPHTGLLWVQQTTQGFSELCSCTTGLRFLNKEKSLFVPQVGNGKSVEGCGRQNRAQMKGMKTFSAEWKTMWEEKSIRVEIMSLQCKEKMHSKQIYF